MCIRDSLYIDAIHYSVRDNGVIRKLAAYVILGINTEAVSYTHLDVYKRQAVPMLFHFMVLLRNTLCPITCELL